MKITTLMPLSTLSFILFLVTINFADQADDLSEIAGVHGGLVVLLDANSNLASQFHSKGGWLVHILDTNAEDVWNARKAFRSNGTHESISAEVFDGNELPYVDQLINLLVAPNGLGDLPETEVKRVVSPLGAALIKQNNEWRTIKQQWPDTIDEWTHYLHGPGNNPVANDKAIAEPKGVRWHAGPRWDRHHGKLAGTSAMVSSQGRVFWIRDIGTVAHSGAPGKWKLIARNAFNGVILWQRNIPTWHTVDRNFRTGPAHLTRGLVVDGDQLFVTIPYRGPVMKIDAIKGDSIRIYPETEGAQEIVYHNGILYVVTGFERPEEKAGLNWYKADLANKTAVMAVNAQTGEVLWKKNTGDYTLILPLTLAVTDNAVAVHTQHRLFCLEPGSSGNERWSIQRKAFSVRPGWATPTVSIVDDVLLVADQAEMGVDPDRIDRFDVAPDDWLSWDTEANDCKGKEGMLYALAINENGRELWSTPCAAGFSAPVDILYADSLVWVSTTEMRHGRHSDEFAHGRDLHTGAVQRTLSTADAFSQTHHHRCHRVKATNNYILTSRLGVELIDVKGGANDRNTWVRGACQYGILPANGLIYAPPHACGCFLQAKLAGLWALGPQSSPWQQIPNAQRLQNLGTAPSATPELATDWPTYRHDIRRSGTTDALIDGQLTSRWERAFGTKLSALVVARNVVYFAEVDAHTVHALSIDSGYTKWSYTAGGRIDSPPTIYNGLVLFGSADGHVHCLRADNGQPVWRFMAAPSDRRVISFGKLESAWPVHGSVLVQNGSVWVIAGRSTYLDGGFACWRLDPRTGQVQAHKRLHTDNVETGTADELIANSGRMKGGLDDILSGDGETAFMREMHLGPDFSELNPEYHLFSMVGFLDDEWFSRSYWQYGPLMWGMYRGWPIASDYVPFGRILCMMDDTAYGFRRPSHGCRLENTNNYVFYKSSMNKSVIEERMPAPDEFKWSGVNREGCLTEHWSTSLPIWVRAMAVTGDAIVVAGPNEPRRDHETEDALAGKKGSRLMVASRSTGDTIQNISLASPPVWDGMAVVPGFVLVSCIDGTLRCFSNGSAVSVRSDKKNKSIASVKGKVLRAAAQNGVRIGSESASKLDPEVKKSNETGLSQGLTREYWSGIWGKTIETLLDNTYFPASPTGKTVLERMETPQNWADNYGQRLRGYIVAPETGLYQFWIAADEQAVLKLSTDNTPLNAKPIAKVLSPIPARQWDTTKQQCSTPVRLEKGKHYYIEVLHKESGGNDHCAVAWTIPGKKRTIIDKCHLLPID